MSKPILIAEIANAHAGSLNRLLTMLDEIKKTPVTNVKFQLYSGRDICSISHPRREHFEIQSFNSLEWKEVITYAKELGFQVHADIFGFDALEIALEHDLKSLKVHSSDTLNIPLLREISRVSETIFLSCGGTYIGEILEAVDEIEQHCSPECKIVLMHGYQSYPSPINTTALNRLLKLQQIFGSAYLYGYMDHVDGGTDDAIYLPQLALPYNVDYIEKHVTINRSEKLTDYFSSIEACNIIEFDRVLTNYSEAFENRPFQFSEEEKHYRKTTKKQWHISEIQDNVSQTDEYNILMQRPSLTDNGQLHFSELCTSRSAQYRPVPGEVITPDNAINAINIVVVARTSSSRLPQKALIKLPNGDATVIFLLKKLAIGLKDKAREYRICLATSDDPSDDELSDLVRSEGFMVYRGSQSDVLQRIICGSSFLGPSRFTIRITGDDLLIDTDYLDKMSSFAVSGDYDYCENKILPSGMEAEIFKNSCLAQLQRAALNRDGTEYLTFFIRDNKDLFHTGQYTDEYLLPERDLLRSIRLTVDYPEDIDRVSSIMHEVKHIQPYAIGVKDILDVRKKRADLFDIKDKPKVKGLDINTHLDIGRLKHKPLVTIFIVSCNYGRYVENAIKSVFAQTFTQYSLYLVDNNSADNTGELFERYSNIQGVNTVSLESGVLHEANNYILNNCKTKYIMRLDADDELERHALELMVSELERTGNKSYCTCDYYLMDEDRVIYGQEYRFKMQDRSINDIAPHGACTLYNANHIRNQGGYSRNVTCQDGFDMLLKLNKEGGGTHVNLPLFRYRKHPNSLSSNPASLQKARSTLLHGQALVSKRKTCDWAVIFLRKAEIRLITDSIRLGREDHSVSLVKTLKEIFSDRVILSSSSTVEHEWANELRTSLGIHTHVRSSRSSRQFTPIEKSVLEVLQYTNNAETLTIASLCYPLIKEHSIRSCKESIWAFDADRSMTVLRRQSNSFRLSAQGLEPITSVKSLKDERDIVFEEAGGVHTVRTSSFVKYPSLYTGKATPVEISDYEAIRIDTDLFDQVTGSK